MKFEIADSIWQLFLWNFDIFARICLATLTRGFVRSLITNLKSESHKSKWWIQDSGQVHEFLVKLWRFCSNSLRNGYPGVFEVADYESEVRISELRRTQYGGWVDYFWVRLWKFCSYWLRNGYSGVFEIADNESEVRISNSK